MLPGLSRMSEGIDECPREGGSATRFLVLEVDVHALPAGGVAQLRRPIGEVGRTVGVAPQPQVPEGRRGDGRGREVVAVRDAEGRPMAGEQPIGLIGEPARVPKLEGGLEAGWKNREEIAQPLGIEAEVGWELEEE